MSHSLQVRLALLVTASIVPMTACESGGSRAEPESPSMAAFTEVLSPKTLQIEGFTRPVSFTERRAADGIEVVVRALDGAGDPVKAVGTWNIDLYTMGAGKSRLGQRLSNWTVTTSSLESQAEHWERFGRFYRFVLQLDTPDLPAGRYVVNAALELPQGPRLFGEYTMSHSGGPVPPATLANR